MASLPEDSVFGDEPFLRIAKATPEFAGYYYSAPGQMAIAVTDPDAFSAVRDRIASANAASAREVTHPQYVPRYVEHSFMELARYRTVLRQAVFAVPGVVSLSVDEVRNQVTVGTSTGQATSRVEALLIELGIPASAALIEARSPVSLFELDLRDEHPSGLIEGGWEGSNPCTIGFPARRLSDSVDVFVHASHCTQQIWGGADHGPILQPKGGDTIGLEKDDPPALGIGCGGEDCRHSEAAMILATASLSFAKIARTTKSEDCEDCAAALTIDTTNPTFRIVNSYGHNVIGETLHKVGRTTGWTYGDVKHTCEDIQSEDDDRIRLCSDIVDFSADPGDSGSPVFKMVANGVELRGVVWGGDATCWPWEPCDAFVSDFHQIQLDLGTLVVAVLIIGIEGPEEVPGSATCEWSATVQGAVGSVSYEWRKDGQLVGTNSSVALDTGSSDFQLSLEATDAYDQVFEYINVDVGPPGQFACPF